MPEPLWAAAVAVAREHGIYAASRGLRISYESLKLRLTARRSKGRALKSATDFVELGTPLPFANTPAGATVELADADGAKLAVHLAGNDPLDLVGLAREFWSRRT
jgi:hypothetical protein